MGQQKILVADDETHILNVVSIKLANAGYEVITAEDGADAYALARSAKPDLISSRNGPMRTDWLMTVRSTATIDTAPAAAIFTASRSISMLSASCQRASDDGKWTPMSPRLAAPSTASVTA